MRLMAWIADRPTWQIAVGAFGLVAVYAAIGIALFVAAPSLVTAANLAVVWAFWVICRATVRDLVDNDLVGENVDPAERRGPEQEQLDGVLRDW